jgi:3-hydroxyisobutyrate dehydrogenase
MAGGTEAALNAGSSILATLSDSTKLYLVGGIGAGSNMKMVHQVLAGIHILGASEAMGFAARLGLGAVETAERIKGSAGWTWMHENRLGRMLEEDWNPGASALTIILKDVVSSFFLFLGFFFFLWKVEGISLIGRIGCTMARVSLIEF